jgi:hypothetical protein
MAQMPRGGPRSVRDPAGEQYDEMTQREQLKKRFADANTMKMPASPLAPFKSPLASLFAGPTSRPIVVTRNGRAVCLVPPNSPPVSTAERAERQMDAERVLFMAGNPLAAAYGLAALANASPRGRDQALMVGGLVDAAMLGAAPRGAPVLRRPTPPGRQPAPTNWDRPNVRYRELNANGQATGVTATVTPPMLGAGTKANRRLKPPGWQGNGTIYNEARGHLLANQLGGSGRDPVNLVTQTHRGSNTPQMSGFEERVARRVRAGEVVEYSALPLYNPGVLPPSAILLSASGSRGAPSARVVNNPAGRRR